jgi:predicted MPP superfamily phosphohydrolase
MKIRLKLWVKIVLTILVLFSFFILYSRYIGTNGLKVKEYSIINSKIPESFYGIKVVHISDINYKVTTNLNDLQEVVDEINLLKPDIVILSGDLFNKDIEYTKKDYNDLIKALNNIKYNIGKYAIKGDNDLNIKKWESVINDSDFINLNDTYELIYNDSIEPILLVGISSNNKKNHIKNTIKSINEQIKETYSYSILTLHEPDYINNIDYSNYNLILAGHSLNGQIKLPWLGGIIRPNGAKKYYDEYYELDNTMLYISGGIGTNNFKFRFNNKPSFNLYRLRNK